MKICKTNNVKLNKINMAVLGPSKSGKTFLSSTIKGKPLICNADKGMLTLKDSKLDYVTITSWDEFVKFMKFITSSDQFVKAGFDWVVFDSVSAIAEILKKHLEEKGVTGFDFWNEYKKLMGGLLATTRDTDRFHSLSIYEMIEKENASGLLEKKFGLEGSLGSQVGYFYDFVLASKKIVKKDKEDQYVLQTTPKDGYNSLGGRISLNDYEPANIQHIMKKLGA